MASDYNTAKFTNNIITPADDSPLKAEADYVKAGLQHVFGAVSAVTSLNVTVGRVTEVLTTLKAAQPEAFGSFGDLPARWTAYLTARAANARKRGGKVKAEGSVARASLATLFGDAVTVAEAPATE